MAVSSVSSILNTPTTLTQNVTSDQTGIMGKDDFLKLFLASLQYQDPMSPLETKDMMGQMSQLTMIEQITNMSKVVEQLSEIVNGSPIERGVDFLGKTINGSTKEGEKVVGKVEEIVVNNGLMELIVNNKTVTVGSIQKISV